METPPRTWGRPADGLLSLDVRGNTPTHVGKTDQKPAGAPPPRKHPHARGEDPGCNWGCIAGVGNTPTHVGKTDCGIYGQKHHEKHPHARGEDTSWSMSANRKSETPPRTWGRRRCSHCRSWHGRNTPTHVGKTLDLLDLLGLLEKHPHARGEDAGAHVVRGNDKETPPRTWGRHLEFISFFPFIFQ